MNSDCLRASKRSFGHPVPEDAIAYFCHPKDGHHYDGAAWGRDGNLWACNGHVAVRFFNFTAAHGSGSMDVVDRLQKLRWHTSKHENPKAWRKLDDCTLDLFRCGVLDPWDKSGRWLVAAGARVNHGIVLPVVSLQLISRLPRCEIYTDSIGDREPVPFRFNGGIGLLARLSWEQELRLPEMVCHVFATRRDW